MEKYIGLELELERGPELYLQNKLKQTIIHHPLHVFFAMFFYF
jgi:hypothetical protein